MIYMKELAINKIKILLNDLELNSKKEKQDGKSYFNTDLFYIRVKEILKVLESE